MNKSFLLLDKNNNLQKNADIICRFSLDECDYLVYNIDENEDNGQIFVSKLILNSEGKYFIDTIFPEEKNKLSNIVYNIVIILPSDAQKGISFDSLVESFNNKFLVKFSNDIPDIDVQEYYSSSSIAVTSKILIDSAIKFYGENLIVTKTEEIIQEEVPTWTAPAEVTSPVEAPVEVNNETLVSSTPIVEVASDDTLNNIPKLDPTIDLILPVEVPTDVNNDILESSSSVVPVVEASSNEVLDNVVTPEPVVEAIDNKSLIETVQNNTDDIQNKNTDSSNPQVKKLAVISDPSLNAIGLDVNVKSNQQPNIGKIKNAGFASNKYVIIGSICLVLAIAVVVTVYILITNMTK